MGRRSLGKTDFSTAAYRHGLRAIFQNRVIIER